MGKLKAGVIPFLGKSNPDIVVYVVTGVHGLIKIPDSYCKECNLFLKSAEDAAEELDFEVDIDVRSYWSRFLYPLLKGGTHPPVMIIDGEVVAQGYDVPEKEKIKKKLKEKKE